MSKRLDLIGFLSSEIWPKLSGNKGKLCAAISGATFLPLKICHVLAACGNSTASVPRPPLAGCTPGYEPQVEKTRTKAIRCEFAHGSTSVSTIPVRKGSSGRLSGPSRFYMWDDTNLIRREVHGGLKH